MSFMTAKSIKIRYFFKNHLAENAFKKCLVTVLENPQRTEQKKDATNAKSPQPPKPNRLHIIAPAPSGFSATLTIIFLYFLNLIRSKLLRLWPDFTDAVGTYPFQALNWPPPKDLALRHKKP